MRILLWIAVLILLALGAVAVAWGCYAWQQRTARHAITEAAENGNRWAGVLNDARLRDQIQAQACRILPEDGSRCAVVQSLFYFATKGQDITTLERSDVWAGTAGFEDYLRQQGWREVRDLDALAPGMICFSQDRRGRAGAADHVYTFGGWLSRQRRVALVWDNYQPELHPRNMLGVTQYWFTRYHNTPFAFALTPPA